MITIESQKIRCAASAVRHRRAAASLARADRNQVLLLREPVHGIEEQVAVARDAEIAVGDEVRVAKDRNPRLRFRRMPAWLVGCSRGRGRVGDRGRDRRGERHGTGLVSLVQLASDLAGRGQFLDVAFRPAVRAGLDEVLRRVPAGPARDRRDRSRQRIRGHQVEVLGDRMRGRTCAATGTDTSVPSSWPMPLTSTTTLVPISIPQSFSSADRFVTCGASGPIRRIEQKQDLAALGQVRA